jgi:hypothetical protein
MATELTAPHEELGVREILDALGVGCRGAGDEPRTYLVIPGNSGPRWLIPERSRASASVLSAWHPYDLSSRMKWFGLRMAARSGLLRLLPSVAKVETSRSGALRWFEWCGIQSRSGEMVVLVGNPSPDRKLIAFLLHDARPADAHPAEAHRIAAVLKVGLTEGGGASLQHEAEALGRLELGRLEQYSWAPRLLSVHPELRAAAQEYVEGEMPGRGFRPEYMEILCQLPRSGGSKSLTDLAAEMARRLRPFKARLDEMAPDLLDRSLDCLDRDLSVPTVLVHGDLAPWNMRNNASRGYVLVDWEWAEFEGLPAYDLLHFQFNDDRLFGEKAGGYEAIRARPICAEYFRRMDLDPELLPPLAAAYLLRQLEFDCLRRGTQPAAYTLRQLAVLGL